MLSLFLSCALLAAAPDNAPLINEPVKEEAGDAPSKKAAIATGDKGDNCGDWTTVLWILCPAGAFGGMLGVLRLIEIKRLLQTSERSVHSWLRLTESLLIGAFGGIGAAIASITLLLADDKLKFPLSDEIKAGLCATGVIAGFVGYHFLTLIGEQLEKRFSQVEEGHDRLKRAMSEIEVKTVQAEEVSARAEIESAIAMGYSVAALAKNAQAKGEHFDTDATNRAIEKLEAVLAREPLNRSAAITLARIYRYTNRLDKAIDILSEAIQQKANGRQHDNDCADFLYNRSCYYILDGADRHDPSLKRKALDDLAESIRIAPHNTLAARKDADFDSLREDEEFKRIVGNVE